MGADHHVHTQSDPKVLKEAQELYAVFLIWSRNFTIALAIVLLLMAIFLVG